MWELDSKESWAPKNWCFWTVVWRRPLRVPWIARRSNLPVLKEISPECSLSQWRHPTIASSIVPFSSCPQSFPASGSFSMSQFFTSGGQSTGVSALPSFLPKKSQGWFPSEWTGWISLQSKGLSRVFSNTTVQKHQFFGAQLYGPTLTSVHDYWKNHSFD